MWGTFLLFSFVTITVPDISFSTTYSSFSKRICEGGGVFSFFLHAKESGHFLEEFMGGFPRTQRPSDGRFCSAWAGSILKPRLWNSGLLKSGRGRQRVRRFCVCHRKREPRGADGGSFVLELDGQPALHRRCLDACNTYCYIYTI